MIEKGELIVGEINIGWGPISPVLVDVGTVRVHGSLIDTGTVPIPESRVDIGIVHAHASMPTGV